MKNFVKNQILKIAAVAAAVFMISSPAVMSKPKCHVDSPVMDVVIKYEDCEGVEAFNLGSFLLGIARMAASDEDGGQVLKYLSRMAVFSAEDAPADLQKKIKADLDAAVASYETAMEMKDGEDDMSILVKRKGEDIVSEMVLVSNSDLSVIVMIGEMPVSELEMIASEASEQ